MVRVREFDPVIYPRKLWIAITTENIADRFKDLEEFEADYASAATDSTADILWVLLRIIIKKVAKIFADSKFRIIFVAWK